MKKYLPIVIGLGLFGFILYKIDINSTWAILKQADLGLCLVCLLTFLVMVYLKGIRWSYLLKMQGQAYSVWNCFLIYMGSLFWGNVTPGRVGDFIKIFYLQEDLKLPMGKAMPSVLVDRVFDLYILLVLGGAGLLVNPMPVDPDAQKLVLAVKVFFLILIAVSFLAFNQRIGGVLLKKVFQRVMKQEHKEATGKAFEEFHKGLACYYKPALAIPILLTTASYLVYFWGCEMLAHSIGLPLGYAYIAFCISVVNIVSLVTFLGMGTREGALILLFGLVSLSREQAVAYSMLILFVGSILFSLLGFFCYLLKPIQLKGIFKKEISKKNSSKTLKTRKKKLLLTAKTRSPRRKAKK
jgi:hypothetical protein